MATEAIRRGESHMLEHIANESHSGNNLSAMLKKLHETAREYLKNECISGYLEIKGWVAWVTGMPFCGTELPLFRLEQTKEGYQIIKDKAFAYV